MIKAFQNQIVPSSSKLIGYSWLIDHFNLEVFLRQLCCVSEKRLATQTIYSDKWLVFDSSFMVEDDKYKHLEFAIKHEHIDLLILKGI